MKLALIVGLSLFVRRMIVLMEDIVLRDAAERGVAIDTFVQELRDVDRAVLDSQTEFL